MYRQWGIREMNRDRSKGRENLTKEQGGYILGVRGEGGKTKDGMIGRQIFFASLEETGL